MKRLIHNGLASGLVALVILSQAQMAWSQQAPVRGIERIAGDVYRFRDNHHYSVFMVTPEGVIATDPINADAAIWLK
ncbi:MAG: hypothetical protein IH904_08310, partial [Proteobacteria bacterium]|nr:hypothetical protein [Pseudomonadota bacterium]